jgi:hypothetical protein
MGFATRTTLLATTTSGSALTEGRSALLVASKCTPIFSMDNVPAQDLDLMGFRWNRVTLLVQMNDPADVANGNIQL